MWFYQIFHSPAAAFTTKSPYEKSREPVTLARTGRTLLSMMDELGRKTSSEHLFMQRP
jgi:hypothetical protein